MFRVSTTHTHTHTHTLSGVHKTVTTTSGTGRTFVQLPPSNAAKLAWLQLHYCVPMMMGVVDTRNM